MPTKEEQRKSKLNSFLFSDSGRATQDKYEDKTPKFSTEEEKIVNPKDDAISENQYKGDAMSNMMKALGREKNK